MKEILNILRKPFTPDRIEWRLQSCGEKQDGSIWAKCLCYIDNRAAQERLDEVFEDGWSSHETFQQIGDKAVCVVEINIHEAPGIQARSVTGTCAVEANGDIDPFKSAASGAMKRAVVNLGIGRYLYDLPETWAIIDPKGKYDGKTKTGTRFRWNPPGIDANTLSMVKAESANFIDDLPTIPAIAPVKALPIVESDGTWRTVIIPFGKQKGMALGSLPAASLKWWRENYQPKPFKGKISDKDKAFRDALDQSAGPAASKSAPDIEVPAFEEPEAMDDVPF
jgi:hypothetical protein